MQKTAKLNVMESLSALYKRYQSLIRFALVGCINTGVDFLSFSALHSIAGADKLLSQAAGYSMGTLNSFVLNKLWTFERSRPVIGTAKQLLRFLSVNVVSLALSLVGMNYFTKYYGLGVYSSKIVVTLLSQAVNYFGYKLFVFGPSQKESRFR